MPCLRSSLADSHDVLQSKHRAATCRHDPSSSGEARDSPPNV